MSKDKFIEFCIDYLPYKECVERYVGDGVKTMAGLVLLGMIYLLVVGVIWETTRS